MLGTLRLPQYNDDDEEESQSETMASGGASKTALTQEDNVLAVRYGMVYLKAAVGPFAGHVKAAAQALRAQTHGGRSVHTSI